MNKKGKTSTLIAALTACMVFAAGCSGSNKPQGATAATTAPQRPATLAPDAGGTPSIAPNVGAVGIAGAYAKTKSAARFRVSEKLSGIGALVQVVPSLPADQNVVLIGTEGEVNGKDSHLTTTGLPAMLFADDPNKGLETIQVDGKTYAHGPSASLNAPEDKWYLLASGSSPTMTISPLQLLDSAAAANGDWQHFARTASGQAVDGKKCDTYTADTNAVGVTFAAMMKGNFPATVVDSGTAKLSVCDDGYIHSLTVGVQAHDQAKPATTGKVDFTLHLYDFDGDIAIQAPADAVALAGGQGTEPTAAAVVSSPTPQAGQVQQGAPGDYSGSWEGSNSADTPINFEIENNLLTVVNLNYALHVGDCSLSGGFSRSVNNPVTVSNGAFTVKIDDSDGKQYVFVGKLSSDSASGTLEVKGTSDQCGAYDDTENWTAKKGTTITEKPTVEPTDVPTPAAATDTGSDSQVVQSFFDALNAQDVDSALALVDDSVIYTFGSTTGIGTDDLRTYLQTQVNVGASFDLSNIATNPASVNFAVNIGGTSRTGKAIIQDGKIAILNLQ